MKFDFTPFPTLETKRLVLRKPTIEDCNDILFLRSNPVVNQFIKRDTNITIDDAMEFYHRTSINRGNGESIDWAVSLKGNNQMIGSLCLWNFSEDGMIGEVGYALKPMFQHQGIMSEALGVVLRYGLDVLKFNEITAYTQYNNVNSIGLLTKLNFTLCTTERDEENPMNRVYRLKGSAATFDK